jgi:prepilin-type N-terminal cleavage/methylation domain-containing protein
MIHFKNRKTGFTLIETIIALMMVAVLLTPVFLWQGSIFQRVTQYSARALRIMLGHNFFLDTRMNSSPDDKKLKKEKKVDDIKTKFIFERKEVPSQSAVAQYPGILTERVTISWEQQNKKYTQNLISFIFVPPSEDTHE